jgi:hypothetical protein
MSARKAILVLCSFLLLLLFTVPAASEPRDSIVVNGADTLREESVSISQGLVDSAAGIGSRIVLQYANQLRSIGLAEAPSALQTELEQVPDRAIVQYANTIRHGCVSQIVSLRGQRQ